MNRRELVAGLGGVVVMQAMPQVEPLASGGGPYRGMMKPLASAANSLYNQNYTKKGLTGAAAVARVLAEDANSNGIFAKLDSQIRAGKVPTFSQSQIDGIMSTLTANGLKVDRNLAEKFFHPNHTDLKNVLTKAGGGIHLANWAANALDDIADSAPVAGLHVENVMMMSPPFCHDQFSWYSGVVGTYFGVVALAVSGPVGWSIGMFSMTVGFASMLASC